MSPRRDHLPPQDTDDSVKPLRIVWQQLVSISAPHLQRRRWFVSANLHTRIQKSGTSASHPTPSWFLLNPWTDFWTLNWFCNHLVRASHSSCPLTWSAWGGPCWSRVSHSLRWRKANVERLINNMVNCTCKLTSPVCEVCVHTCVLLYPPHPCRDSFKIEMPTPLCAPLM